MYLFYSLLNFFRWTTCFLNNFGSCLCCELNHFHWTCTSLFNKVCYNCSSGLCFFDWWSTLFFYLGNYRGDFFFYLGLGYTRTGTSFAPGTPFASTHLSCNLFLKNRNWFTYPVFTYFFGYFYLEFLTQITNLGWKFLAFTSTKFCFSIITSM